ncbi:D-lactate dehydrogenase (cytochrome) [Desulfurispirillum indicum S5]|uniref:D-lactate dehydrogenase (cytochrome) n=1 Tax=Desulfurispirillum indicum (strain ATCC BAA-1389 / DSM 22839 / S5) TaxID=653733 RepID=E6W5E9_DESIS|nr:FAD-binding and (Fe-S)-binding domain-containing protein [Desulfurispirillum indicum]ADU64880.1 D-lactate dehydrogenase (cytochrome) [Desulfurispirillum indicum S5]
MNLSVRPGDIAKLPSTYQEFYREIAPHFAPQDIIADPLRTLAYGTDASFYRLIPKLVVKAGCNEQVVVLLQVASRLNIALTFRAAGTSLSGQAISDSILVMLAEGWSHCDVDAHGCAITMGPAVIGAEANRVLKPFSRKIGPDPASINHAMIGGIAANNASGMCCGTADNSYKTVQDMTIIFHDGTVLDTADPDSVAAFRLSHGHLISAVESMRDDIGADAELSALIRHKFKIKNTTGYGINAFVDFDDPIDIIKHLMIGSEGTLGFIARITYRTVHDHSHKASSLALFPDIRQACLAVMRLNRDLVSAAELMDRKSLQSVEDKAGMPEYLRTLDSEVCGLLIEVEAENHDALHRKIDAAVAALEGIPTARPLEFSTDKAVCAQLWNIRKGLFPAVGAMRTMGTTVIIEDVAYPMEHLADAISGLRAMLDEYGYTDSIIFGHALDGNVHFVFTQDFAKEEQVRQYDALMQEVCNTVTGQYGGSLKAEHGTGRNMAPFVEMEWGKQAYSYMLRIKQTFDPQGILNPGVIINEDSLAHLKDLKHLPATHEIIDKCIECGFCEVNCPSRNLTLTPRQRITTQRYITSLRAIGQSGELLKRVEDDYQYMGEATCAADGLCATTCPVAIDTGSHTKNLRSTQNKTMGRRIAGLCARNFAPLTKGIALALGFSHIAHRVLGKSLLGGLSRAVRSLSGGKIPAWDPWFPKAAWFRPVNTKKVEATHAPRVSQDGERQTLEPGKEANVSGRSMGDEAPRQVVYFPACVSRSMGPAHGDLDQRSLTEAMLSLLEKAGYEVIYPANLDALCCGTPFESKGFMEEADAKSSELEKALLAASDSGRIPVLCDTSPCLYRMRRVMDARLKLLEPVEFIHDHLLGHLNIEPLPETVAIHITCSATKMNLQPKFQAVAAACARSVVSPPEIKCCGFAGDRGFNYPELNASALAPLKAALPADCKSGYSNSRTCEIGLARHSGISYQSIVYLVDRVARPRSDS